MYESFYEAGHSLTEYGTAVFNAAIMTSEYLNNKAFEEMICRFQRSKRLKEKYGMIVEDLTGVSVRIGIRAGGVAPGEIDKYHQLARDASAEFEVAKVRLADSFYLLAGNVIRYMKFNYIDTEDASQEAVVTCFEKIDRFDPRKGKAFCYYTTCIINLLKQMYRSTKNYTELKRRYQEHVIITTKAARRRRYS